jgi:photosystem II stability/assembly factor-like uncharacterized protein
MRLSSRRIHAALLTMLVLAALSAAAAATARAADKDAGEESAEVSKAVQTFMAPRAAPGAAIAPGAFPAARSYAAAVPSVDSTTWSELGPYKYFPDNHDYISQPFSNAGSGAGFNTGRITGIAVAPDGSVYAGGAGGGVWRSSDPSHQSWTPTFDGQSTMAIGTVSVVPRGSGYTVYAGTGEPTINLDSYAGVGVLASTDKGASWHRVGGSELQGAGIFKIVATPDGGTLFAATSHGLYRHTGADSTAWTQVIGDPDSGPLPNAQVLNLISDVAIRPGTSGKEVIAWRGWRAGGPKNGLWVSRDGGAHFTGPLSPQGFAPPKSLGRGSVAYSADGAKLYVMIQDASTFNSGAGQTVLQGIYESNRDVDGPFNQIASSGKLQSSGSAQKPGEIGTEYKPGVQAWYNQFLVVDPASSTHVYAGLEEVYETTNGGSSWVAAAPYWNLGFKCFDVDAPDFGGCPNTTHSDQHAATVSGGQLWVGNDGGVFSRPTNVSTAGGGWTDHNQNLGTLQFYYASSGRDGAGRTVFWGGLQDNGTAKLIPGPTPLSPVESSQPFGGDGGDTLVDPANANNVMTEYTNLDTAVTTDGGRNWVENLPPDPNAQFIAPFTADRSTLSSLYAGGEFLWHSSAGFATRSSSWAAVADTGPGHSISAIDVRNGRGYAAWCGPCWPGYTSETGFDRGLMANTGSGWKPVTLPAGFPLRYISGVAVDPGDASGRTAYVTVSGYARHWQIGPTDPGTGHVFKTTDGGTTWTDLSGSGTGALVDAPANDIELVDGRLVVATDVGVYTAPAAGGAWKRVGSGLPNVITTDLSLTPDGRILAATHGRGLWVIGKDALS